MRSLSENIRRLIWLIAVVLLGLVGCSRPTRVLTDAADAPAPFQDTSPGHDSSDAVTGASPVAVDSSSNSSLPFRDSQNLPAGTLLMVRLKGPITPGRPGGHESFEASIDEPVMLGGNTLIPRGAIVIGRVESSRFSKVKPDRGYVRLALETVRISGGDVPVRTYSLFVRQSPSTNHAAPSLHLATGHRLTFRLTEPIYTANQAAPIVR